MSIAEIREMTLNELDIQLKETYKALFDARFKQSLRQLDDSALLRRLRHRIAQIKTVLREKLNTV